MNLEEFYPMDSEEFHAMWSDVLHAKDSEELNAMDSDLLQSLLATGELTPETYTSTLIQMTQALAGQYFGTAEIIKYAIKDDLDDFTGIKFDALEPFAFKLVFKGNVHSKILNEWQNLKHRNIQRLVFNTYMPKLDVCVFTAEFQPYNLHNFVGESPYIKNKARVRHVRRWLREILSALQYLHQKNYCLLSLTTGQVKLTEDFTAVVGAFCCLGRADDLTESYAVPFGYRPPESLIGIRKGEVLGEQFDIWCLGILALNIFTKGAAMKRLPEACLYWNDDVYPHLFEVLKMTNFRKCVEEAFPDSNVKKKTVELMRNFVTSCLKFNPIDRLHASELSEHEFLDYDGTCFTPDKVWEKRGSQLENLAPKEKQKNRGMGRVLDWITFVFQMIRRAFQ